MTADEILKKYSWPTRTTALKTSIKEIESLAQFSLPDDYKTFIQTYSGSEDHIGEQLVRLWDADEIIEQNKGYHITDNLSMTIGIGSNGTGEFIAIEMTDKDTHRIVLSPYIDLDKNCHIEIGNSFTDFLHRLNSGREWFENS